jgi:Zn-dependent M28 family amino/carboxypeptidase
VAYLAQQPPRRTVAIAPIGLIVTPSVFDRTLARACGGTYAEWRKRLASGKGEGAKAVPATVEVGIEVQPKDGRAANVVAVVRGTDPALRDEWVVLSAHYDHLGRIVVQNDQDGIFNGADDNASGTAAVIEVARLLRAGPPPRRSVLVLLTAGEECGLLGSGYYSFNPLVPRESVVANVNLDMIGRSEGSVIAIADVSEDLFRTAAEIGGASGIKIEPDPNPTWRFLYRVDSYHFAREGVPAIEFFTNMHKDYHQPSDTADLIHYDQLARITDAVHRLVDHYAQGGSRPAFKRPEWFLVPD